MKNSFLLLLCIQLGSMSFLDAGIIGEIFKIPALLDHHAEHQQKAASNFWTFITTHYWGDESTDTDHDSFPFHQVTCGHFVKCVPQEVQPISFTYPPAIRVFTVPRKLVSIDAYEAIGIWQPPSFEV